MAQDILNLNEESFEQIIETLSRLVPELQNHYNTAVKRIAILSGEWDDEDYHAFAESLTDIKKQIDSVDETTVRMINETKRKLEMLQARPQYKNRR